MSDPAVKGAHFAWVKGMREYVPTVFHEGILKSELDSILWKIPIGPEEKEKELRYLATKYPLDKALGKKENKS